MKANTMELHTYLFKDSKTGLSILVASKTKENAVKYVDTHYKEICPNVEFYHEVSNLIYKTDSDKTKVVI